MDKSEKRYWERRKKEEIEAMERTLDLDREYLEEQNAKLERDIETISEKPDFEIVENAPYYPDAIREAEINELKEIKAPEPQIEKIEDMDDNQLVSQLGEKHADAIRDAMIAEKEQEIEQNNASIFHSEEQLDKLKDMPLPEFKNIFE